MNDLPTGPPPASAAPVTGDTIGTDRWYLSGAPMARALAHLCLPLAAGFLVGAVYNVITAAFIGSLHDTALLAAVTFGTPLLTFVSAFGAVFGVGAGALIGRLFGAAEHDPASAREIRHVSSFGLWASVITGAVVGGVGLLLLGPLVSLLGADGAALAPTRAYTAVLLAFVPLLSAAGCLGQLVRAEGAARQSMISLIASTVANLVLDVLFILVLHLGVAGAALSIGLSNIVSVWYLARWVQRHSEHMNLAPRWFTLRATVLNPVLGVGVSTLFSTAFVIVTDLLLNNLAAGYGDAPLAAIGVAVRLAQPPEFLVLAITMGVLPLLSYTFGNGDRDRFVAGLRAAVIAVGVIVAVCAAVVFTARGVLFTGFSTDPAVLAIGATAIIAQLAAIVAAGFTRLATSLFQATGRALPATAMSTAQGLLFIPVVILGNLWFGLAGVIWALACTEAAVVVVGAATVLAVRRGIERDLAAAGTRRAAQTSSSAWNHDSRSTRTTHQKRSDQQS